MCQYGPKLVRFYVDIYVRFSCGGHNLGTYLYLEVGIWYAIYPDLNHECAKFALCNACGKARYQNV